MINHRRIIARANRLLYDQSDRIKSMHSKMQLSDTLAEREAQVQLKDELNRLEQIREERFLEMGKHNYRKMLERELRERVELEDRQRECTKVQQEQLAASRAKTDQAKGDNRMEGRRFCGPPRQDDGSNDRRRREGLFRFKNLMNIFGKRFWFFPHTSSYQDCWFFVHDVLLCCVLLVGKLDFFHRRYGNMSSNK